MDEKTSELKSAGRKKSKSPQKESPLKSAKSSKSVKSGGKSKSPKRKLTAKEPRNDYIESSIFEMPKSTPELEDLTGQGLTVLNAKIFQKYTLRKLVLAGNNLRSLPLAITDLINLEHLDLSRNPLRVKDVDDSKCLPLEMRLLRNLKYLSISECNLRYIPTTVWLLVTVKKLDLSRNKIGLLVPDIGNLQQLTHLNLSQCNLTTLPAEIGFCSELIEILLMANQIESLPDTLKDCIKLENLKMSYRSFTTLLDSYMENLISKGQIKSEHVPIVVFEMENLRTLDLKNTKINNLPENNLKNLNELFIDNNYFEAFTEPSFKLMSQQLKVLTISRNLLKDIPNEILNLPNLEVLDLSFNSISNLPGRMNLAKLKELYLQNNCLKNIIGSIAGMKSLEKLNLEKNQISDIVDSIYELKNLNYFDLSYNKLNRISPKISALSMLKSAHSYEKLNKTGLWVIGNPLIIPPKNIWQTNNIDKIYQYLSGFNQKTLNYTFYSKLIFLGCSGIGKSSLIDCFFNNQTDVESTHKKDNRTIVARKFYKRTSNKVEWMILDFGGHDIYKQLHPLFFSSIDHENEPTIFVIVYKHSEYNNENFNEEIGKWIHSIMSHSKASNKVPIRIKLIGLIDPEKSELDTPEKLTQIKENCTRKINEYFEKLSQQKSKIENMIQDSKTTDENKTYLKTVLQTIENNLKVKFKVYDEITLVDSKFRKKDVKKVVNDLENLTIKLKKIAPLSLNTTLKTLLPKFEDNLIDYDSFYETLNTSPDLQTVLKQNKNFNLNTQDIVNYCKTIGEIFWIKFDADLNKHVYLHYEYILNCLRLFIRHDLGEFLISDQIKLFYTCGYFQNEFQFKQSIYLCNKYGILEDKLYKFICFSTLQLKKDETTYAIDLLNKFLFLYKSETQYLEDECSFYQVVLPFKCSVDFEEDKKSADRIVDSEIYTDEFFKYFIRLDKLRNRREEIKEINALRKQKELWSSQETEFYDEIEGSSRESRLSSIDKPKIEPLKFDFIGEMEHLNKLSEDEVNERYKHKAVYDICSVYKIQWHFFNKFSILIQNFVYERYDWKNVIIARDIHNNCLKITLFNEAQNDEFKIRVEMIGAEVDSLQELKKNLNEIVEKMDIYYPGLFLTKKFTLF